MIEAHSIPQGSKPWPAVTACCRRRPRRVCVALQRPSRSLGDDLQLDAVERAPDDLELSRPDRVLGVHEEPDRPPMRGLDDAELGLLARATALGGAGEDRSRRELLGVPRGKGRDRDPLGDLDDGSDLTDETDLARHGRVILMGWGRLAALGGIGHNVLLWDALGLIVRPSTSNMILDQLSIPGQKKHSPLGL